jgi:hypothetical protein
MSPFITVVSGLPRSGTSLMMQMLAAGGFPLLTDNVRQPDEDNPRGYLEFEPVKRTAADASWVEQAPGKAVKVVYALLRDLPVRYEYRVILMHRALPETIASQRAMLERSGRKGADVAPEKLLAIFARELRDTEDWLARHPNFRTLHVSFVDCLEHPADVAREVSGFLAPAPVDAGGMSLAVDRDLYRQRRTGTPG